MRRVGGILFDLDMTLIDTSSLLALRRARNWSGVYALIPNTAMLPGIRQAVEVLSRHLPCGIVTTSPRTYAERVLKYHNLSIPVLAAYHDTPHHKPYPAPILLGVQKLGIAPQLVASVGDEPNDITAGLSAGVTTVAVTWGGARKSDLVNAGPALLVDTPSQLVALLLDQA